MARRRRVALDHNFPKPILEVVQRFIPEVEFVRIQPLDAWLADLEDHDLIYELARRQLTLMATTNYKMLNDESVLVAVHQTKLTVFAIEGVGDDSILAAGALLRDVLPALRKLTARGQVFRFRPTAPRAEPAFDALVSLATRRHDKQSAQTILDELRVRNWRGARAPLDPS